MTTKLCDRLPTIAAVILVVTVVGACAFHLRGDESETSTATSADQSSDPLAAKLAGCRSVTVEQKDALSDCRKAWAEKRRRFLGQEYRSAPSDNATSQQGSPLFVPKDQSRAAPDVPSIPQSGKE